MEHSHWVPKGVRANLLGFQKLQSETISRGLCSGCGVCIAACPSRVLSMPPAETDPVLVGKCPPSCDLCSRVCPGSHIPLTESEKRVFGRARREDERLFGIYRSAYCSQAATPEIAIAGNSGGTVTALLAYGLDSGALDCAIVVGFDKDQPWKAVPVIVTSRQELMEANNLKSKYSISQTASAIRKAVEQGFTKIGITALPCYTMGLRKMQLSGLRLMDNVRLIIGLFCLGHNYIEGTEYLIKERLGVPLEDVERICYLDERKNFTVWTRSGETRTMEVSSVFGAVPSLHLFGVERCNVCLDSVNELSDIAVGSSSPGRDDLVADARAKGYGHLLSFIRTAYGEQFFNGAVTAGYVTTTAADTPEYPLDRWYVGNPSAIRKRWANTVRIRQRQKYGMPVPRLD